jgi:serine protease Do
MRVPKAPCLVAALALLLADGHAAAQAEQTIAAMDRWRRRLYDRIAPSVVLVSSSKGFGSGFVAGRNLVLTNAHLLGGAKVAQVVFYGGEKRRARVVERAREQVDLALLSTDTGTRSPLDLGDPQTLSVGSWVGSIGHGEGAIWALNTGMVSNIYPSGSKRPVFQTQIPLNPGSSGAPIFDRRGRVIGVATAGIRQANSINFAIRIDVARESLSRLRGFAPRLIILAPPGTPVFLDGKLAGVGPRIVTDPPRRGYEVSAVVAGKLVRRILRSGGHVQTIDLRR